MTSHPQHAHTSNAKKVRFTGLSLSLSLSVCLTLAAWAQWAMPVGVQGVFHKRVHFILSIANPYKLPRSSKNDWEE